MSRSHKHTPIMANSSAASEKTDKKIWHSRMRARQRDELVHADREADDLLPVAVNQVSNPYSMAKDGRSYQPLPKQVNIAQKNARHKSKRMATREDQIEREMVKLMAK